MCPFELSLRNQLAAFVFARARRLLDDESPFLGLRVDNFVYPSLFHDGVGLVSHSCPEKEINYIFKAARDFVDGVFRLSRAEEPAGDHDLGEAVVLRRAPAVLVVEYQRGLCHPGWCKALAAVEDQILHQMTAEVAGALLSHHPSQGINDVGLTAAVGADDCCDSWSELQDSPLRKGLKANHFKAFQTHGLTYLKRITK